MEMVFKYIHTLNRPIKRDGLEASLLKDVLEAMVMDCFAAKVPREYIGDNFSMVLNGYSIEIPVLIDELYHLTDTNITVGDSSYRRVSFKHNISLMFDNINAMTKDYCSEYNIVKDIPLVFIDFPEPQILEITMEKYSNAIRC